MPARSRASPVAEQHVLQVGRAGLGGADVQEDPTGHRAPPRVVSAPLGRRASSASPAPGSSAAPEPRHPVGAPAPGPRGRRGQRSQPGSDRRRCVRRGRAASRGARPGGPAGCRAPRPARAAASRRMSAVRWSGRHQEAQHRADPAGQVGAPPRPAPGGRAGGRRTPTRAGRASGSRTTWTWSGAVRPVWVRARWRGSIGPGSGAVALQPPQPGPPAAGSRRRRRGRSTGGRASGRDPSRGPRGPERVRRGDGPGRPGRPGPGRRARGHRAGGRAPPRPGPADLGPRPAVPPRRRPPRGCWRPPAAARRRAGPRGRPGAARTGTPGRPRASSRSGWPRPGALAPRTRSTSSGRRVRRPGSGDAASSSCWAPGTNCAAGLGGAGPVGPRRRAAVAEVLDPPPGAPVLHWLSVTGRAAARRAGASGG